MSTAASENEAAVQEKIPLHEFRGTPSEIGVAHGETLREALAREGRLGAGRVVDILRQVGEGLLAAHDQGIVHRDLKPDNLFLVASTRGRELVKVLDFGIARVGDHEEKGDRLTRTGSTVGTPAYMSPEQIQGDALDARSDLYSLGCVAYELLSGSVPLTGETMLEVMMAHLKEEPASLRTKVEASAFPLADLVMGLLAKAPEGRLAGAGELLDALEGLSLGAEPCRQELGLRETAADLSSGTK